MHWERANKWMPFIFMALLTGFFALLFMEDNKYNTPPPYGKDGVIVLTENNLRGSKPLYLIDGWLLTDQRTANLPTYIGEFSNLQRGNSRVSPHGRALYQMTLRYDGGPMEVAMDFPILYSHYTIRLDGTIVSEGNASGHISFTITRGNHLLTVETLSKSGYYSGMYHPPALGNTNTIFKTAFLQCIAYAIACFVALALTIFTWTIWLQTKDRLVLWFGALCCCYSLYLSYYFVRLLSLPMEQYWYLVQSAALYGLCYCVLHLAALSGGIEKRKPVPWIWRILFITSGLLLILALLIPVFPRAVWLHGILTNGYYIFTFFATLFMVVYSRTPLTGEQHFTRLACIAFGAGLLYNLLASNLFEPILFFWQFEWCGLLLVLLFGTMMTSRNKRILAENEAFHTHLEELVEQRTEELKNLMQERKAFFADMAHDLKAPVFAAGSFIQAIRMHNTGVDTELLRYIDLVEQKQQEMARRIHGLALFNQMDELTQAYEKISVKELLEETYHAHHMAAEVQSVFFRVEPPEVDGFLYAQHRKLEILFENLIVNALKFTGAGGQITLSATIDEEGCHLSVADTGSGISPKDIPHLFERFYVGSDHHSTGSGLGLYIVKSIVGELNGEVYASSKVGQGSVFFIDLPLLKQPRSQG